MKTIVKILLMSGLIALMAFSCEKDTIVKNCGCDSVKKTYVSDLTGTLLNDSLNRTLYIYKKQPGPMYIFYMVCNQDKVKNITPGSEVIYSGYRSSICDTSQFNIGNTFKYDITISKIQIKQQ